MPHPPVPTRARTAALERARLSTGEYLDRWLAGRHSLRASTRLAYRIHIDRYLAPHLGDIPLVELTAHDIDAMYCSVGAAATAGGRPLSPATLRRIHATLTSALNAAVRRELLARNPATHVELARPIPASSSIWSAEQLAVFLRSVASHRLYPLLLLYATTGMRRGEALGLRWRDIDLDTGTLHVIQQVVVVGDSLLIGPPKTHSGRRSVAAPPVLLRALREHADAQVAERATQQRPLTDAPGREDLVFTTTDGQILHPASVSRVFARLAAEAGLPAIRLHDLRHTSASLGLASGETLLEVSRRLGHSSIAITADVYSHVTPASAHASADRLAHLITGAPSEPGPRRTDS